MEGNGVAMWRIADWQEIFENSQSRKYKSISWVPIPNRHDTDGYIRVIEHDHGIAHYGAWILIVEVASRCTPRGVLVRSGGEPHDCDSLSRITRVGPHIFREAIPRLLEVGWLEDVNQQELVACWERAGSVLGACYPEPNRKEKNKPAGTAADFSFNGSWTSEPWQEALPLYVRARSAVISETRPKPRDVADVCRAALIAKHVYGERWLLDAIKDITDPSIQNRVAVLRRRLSARPAAEGLTLQSLFESVDVSNLKPPKETHDADQAEAKS
jgi:hypothetical protein